MASGVDMLGCRGLLDIVELVGIVAGVAAYAVIVLGPLARMIVLVGDGGTGLLCTQWRDHVLTIVNY